VITLCSSSMKSGNILKVNDSHWKMASFSHTGRNCGFSLHIMKLVLINDFDDRDGWIWRPRERPAPLLNEPPGILARDDELEL
jgi:hypothetical protein